MSMVENIKSKIAGRPTAEALAEQIAAAERGLSAITAALNQADAEASAASADDALYKEAIEHVATVKAQRAAAAERLEHLRRNHRETLAREQAQFIAKLRDCLDALVKTYQGCRGEVRDGKAEEENRHKLALEALDKKLSDASSAVHRQELRIRMAISGTCEADLVSLEGLRQKRRDLNARIQAGNYRSRITECESRAYGLTQIVPADGRERTGTNEEISKFNAEADRLRRELEPLAAEVKAINDDIEAIEAKVGRE